ncbi:hypothetical protein QYF61_005825 [Mycteria americana]|uniref:G-protein coupled receptors family 1 profile domain-containing protein n=1 Tax=Mycteria americana TaxID=33587 RepID=A0AAN7NDM7_MYCAM|nr:hypothetical protein QYF61_005825 [Mycteria americana]
MRIERRQSQTLSGESQAEVLSLRDLLSHLCYNLVNFTIIATVAADHQLHTPMYFLLANLAFLDVSDSSVNTPKLLSGLLTKYTVISFNACFLQMFFHFIASVMAFFLVWWQLHGSVRLFTLLYKLVFFSRFCGSNVDNFYCDVPQVIKLACTDTCMAELQMVFNSGVILIILFVILIISYTVILLKRRTCITEGKQKALFACGTQITIVSLIFIPCIFIYAQSYKKFPMDKVASIVYTAVTPMLNPMIYTLRNTEVKKAIRRTLRKIFLSGGIQKADQPADPKRTDLMLP